MGLPMTQAAPIETLTVDREELLKFFDEKPGTAIGHATSVVAVVGEDLNAACFQHYVESKGGRSKVHQIPVTTGKQRGPWLDRWIVVLKHGKGKILYQTEIKNWSAHAIGGERLPVKATLEEVADYKQKRWERHWDSERQTLKHPHTAKVLVRMKSHPDLDGLTTRPLLIFWEAIGPKEKADDHLFSIPVTYNFPFGPPKTWPDLHTTRKFRKLWVFSVSSYLRSLKDAHIHLHMPNAAHRLQALDAMFRQI